MKRLDLVQLTIIIVGIFSGFFFLLSLPQFLLYLYSWFREGLRGGGYMETVIWNIIVSGSYLLAAFYCIKQSKQFAQWICNNGELNAEVNFALDKSELLFMLFIGLGIYGLITHVPVLLVGIFKKIKDYSSHIETDTLGATGSSNLAVQSITILSFFTLVYYAKIFADFFAGKINNTEPEDEIAATAELND